MNADLIAMSMLRHAAVAALVGSRVAVYQLPDSTAYPAIVVTSIDDTPRPNVDYTNGQQQQVARVQVNAFALDMPTVRQIQTAIRTAMDFQHRVTHAGHLVISSRLVLTGPQDRDPDTGIWTQPVDYALHYYA